MAVGSTTIGIDQDSRVSELPSPDQPIPPTPETDTAAAEPLIAPDAPIENSSQDVLGRTGFAINLATALANLVRGPGVVVGLNGPWGSGKSSLKNLIVEELLLNSAEVEILQFNPWQYETSEQLTREFFGELAIASSSGTENPDEAKQRRAKFWKYGSRVAKVGAAGISAFLPVVGVALEKGTDELLAQIGTVMEQAGEGLAESADRKSLTAVKKELADELLKLERPVLVIIDDIDRLDENEVKLLFKLVKANADFPNVSYLLLFARDRVEAALGGSTEEGDKFLEKIVTVSFDVPALTREDTIRIFAAEVKPLIEDPDVAKRLQLDRWEQASFSCIRPYLDTVRRVRRFTNMLRFLTNVYRDDTGLNVNFVDLAVLEVLRQFEPDVYRQLPHMGAMLTENGMMYLLHHAIDDEARMNLLTGVVGDSKDAGRQPMVRASLRLLFPQIDWTSGDWADYTRTDQELVDLRVNRAAYFPRYFGFDPKEGVLHESQFLEVLTSMTNAEAYRARLDSLTNEQIIHLLLLLIARKEEIPRQSYDTVFETHYKKADESNGSAFLPPQVVPRALDCELLIALLHKVHRDDEQRELIMGIANRIGALALPVMIVNAENTNRSQGGVTENKFISDPLFAELKDWALGKIREAASSGKLIAHQALYELLYFWGWMAGVEEPRAWVTALAGKPDEVLLFLQNVVARTLPEDAEIDRAIQMPMMNYAEDLRALQSDLEELAGRDLTADLRRAVTYGLKKNALQN